VFWRTARRLVAPATFLIVASRTQQAQGQGVILALVFGEEAARENCSFTLKPGATVGDLTDVVSGWERLELDPAFPDLREASVHAAPRATRRYPQRTPSEYNDQPGRSVRAGWNGPLLTKGRATLRDYPIWGQSHPNVPAVSDA